MGTKRGRHRGTKYYPQLLESIYKQVIWAQSDRQSSCILTVETSSVEELVTLLCYFKS